MLKNEKYSFIKIYFIAKVVILKLFMIKVEKYTIFNELKIFSFFIWSSSRGFFFVVNRFYGTMVILKI